MLKRTVIIIVSFLLVLVALGIFLSKNNNSLSSNIANDFMLQKSYLNKNVENYARCYNSINYGSSGIADIRLEIKSQNFNDNSITSERLDLIERAFMDTIMQKCKKTVDDYELAYKKATDDQDKASSTEVVWWNFVFGSSNNQAVYESLSSYSPSSARTSIAFNDYIFTKQEVRNYFDTNLRK